jgi:hypothetical protein
VVREDLLLGVQDWAVGKYAVVEEEEDEEEEGRCL